MKMIFINTTDSAHTIDLIGKDGVNVPPHGSAEVDTVDIRISHLEDLKKYFNIVVKVENKKESFNGLHNEEKEEETDGKIDNKGFKKGAK